MHRVTHRRFIRPSTPFSAPSNVLCPFIVTRGPLYGYVTKLPRLIFSTPIRSFSTTICYGFSANNHLSGPVVPFLLADIGEGITECEITQWFIKEGDEIAQFDKICEVQSDKAAVEISSRFDGVITKLHYNVGDMAKVGTPLIDIRTNESDAYTTKELTTDSPTATEPISSSSSSSSPSLSTSEYLDTQVNSSPKPVSNRIIFATPAVRRLAREHKIDLNIVPATGKGDRILKEDVLQFMSSSKQPASPNSSSFLSNNQASTGNQLSSISIGNDEELRPLSGVQKGMFKSMTKSLSIPHFVYADELRIDQLIKVREAVNKSIITAPNESYPFQKISFMPFLIKSFSLALIHYPLLNAQLVIDFNLPLDQAAQSAKLKYRSQHNISIAMDTPIGLLVPNIKNVQNKSIVDIATDLYQLQEKGKKGSFTTTDLQGGTVSISNIGAIGGTYMSPVVVTSELCIAALGKSMVVPRYKHPDSKQIEAHHIMTISLSADHRVVDGATVARFVQLWKQYVESPMFMLASLR